MQEIADFSVQKNSVAIELRTLKQANVDFFRIVTCRDQSEECEEENVATLRHIVLLAEKGEYVIHVYTCDREDSCTYQGTTSVKIEESSDETAKIKRKVLEIEKEVDKLLVDAGTILAELRETYVEMGEDKVIAGIDYLLSLGPAQKRVVFSDFDRFSFITSEDSKNEIEQSEYALEDSELREDTSDDKQGQLDTAANDDSKQEELSLDKDALAQGLLYTGYMLGILSVGMGFASFVSYSFDQTQGRTTYEIQRIDAYRDVTRSIAQVDGIAAARDSLLISDNMTHFGEILGQRHPHLIAMPVEERVRGNSTLSPGEVEDLKLNIRKRIHAYFTAHPTAQKFPVIGLNINTSGSHWETVIVDLDSLRTDREKLSFEHWNFLQSDSSGRKKIDQIQEAVWHSVKSLSDKQQTEIKYTTEIIGTGEIRPTNTEIRKELDAYFRKYQIKDFQITTGQTRTKEGRLGKPELQIEYNRLGQKIVRRVSLAQAVHPVRGKVWEITIPQLTIIDPPKSKSYRDLARAVRKRPLRAVFAKENFAQIGKNPHLLQGANNCGVASAWVADQRASGLSVEQVRQARPDGFHGYRAEMLVALNKKFPDTILPMSGEQAYPKASYDVSPLASSTTKRPSISVPSSSKGIAFSEHLRSGAFILGAMAFASILSGKLLQLTEVGSLELQQKLLVKLSSSIRRIQELQKERDVLMSRVVQRISWRSHLRSFLQTSVMRKPLGANRERGVWGGEGTVAPPRDFLEEPAAQFPPNHLLAPSGLRIDLVIKTI
ncbi:MAG: hypothetical protein HYW48_03655 [Deltaproteobacteria bacterium]|nr:hypothetical protein [Deltaproteobacteria bacterium]